MDAAAPGGGGLAIPAGTGARGLSAARRSGHHRRVELSAAAQPLAAGQRVGGRQSRDAEAFGTRAANGGPAGAPGVRPVSRGLRPGGGRRAGGRRGPPGAAFAALPFDHLLFTGWTRVGKLIMRSASEHLTPVTLELGGKSPALVHPDFPAQTAAARIMAGKLYNAGQTCLAAHYVRVDAGAREEFVRLASAAVTTMYPRLVDNPDFTRIVNCE